MDDLLLVDVLERSEEYLILQSRISVAISNGFMAMAVARKSVRIGHPEDLRMDLEANTILNPSIAGEGYCVDRWEGEGSAMHMLCGLPPPALKKAQKEFMAAVHLLVELEQKAKEISQICGADI